MNQNENEAAINNNTTPENAANEPQSKEDAQANLFFNEIMNIYRDRVADKATLDELNELAFAIKRVANGQAPTTAVVIKPIARIIALVGTAGTYEALMLYDAIIKGFLETQFRMVSQDVKQLKAEAETLRVRISDMENEKRIEKTINS
jgi:hypothetical protein